VRGEVPPTTLATTAPLTGLPTGRHAGGEERRGSLRPRRVGGEAHDDALLPDRGLR